MSSDDEFPVPDPPRAKLPASMPPPASDGGEAWDDAFDFGRLVPVVSHEIGGMVQATVSARDVHTFLGFTRKFTDWFDDQMARCSLTVDADYREVFHLEVKNPRGGRPRTEFLLTLPAAKKLGMVAEGRRGDAIREYFIECERRLLAGEAPLPGSVPPLVPPVASASSAASRPWAQPFYHPFYDTMAISGSPGPLMGSMPARDVTVRLADFLQFVSHGLPDLPLDARGFDHPNESNVLRYLRDRGRGDECARSPLDGRWVFKLASLQDWYRESGSIAVKPPV